MNPLYNVNILYAINLQYLRNFMSKYCVSLRDHCCCIIKTSKYLIHNLFIKTYIFVFKLNVMVVMHGCILIIRVQTTIVIKMYRLDLKFSFSIWAENIEDIIFLEIWKYAIINNTICEHSLQYLQMVF
jgi:hypothetical protein